MLRVREEKSGSRLRIGSNKLVRITSDKLERLRNRRLLSFLPVDTGVSTAAVAAIKIIPPSISSSRVSVVTELLPDMTGFGYGEFGQGEFGWT